MAYSLHLLYHEFKKKKKTGFLGYFIVIFLTKINLEGYKMDLVLKSFQSQNLINFLRSFSIPIGIMILVAMMVIPLSPWMLDILFTTNILVSLLVLMVALQTFRPLDFSSFPTVLLLQQF